MAHALLADVTLDALHADAPRVALLVAGPLVAERLTEVLVVELLVVELLVAELRGFLPEVVMTSPA